jgi:hypothetical protein
VISKVVGCRESTFGCPRHRIVSVTFIRDPNRD